MEEGGRRYQSCQVYHEARLWNPFYANDTDEESVHDLIRNLHCVRVLDNNAMINALKSSFVIYKAYSSELVAKKPPRIMQWHYSFYHNLKKCHQKTTTKENSASFHVAFFQETSANA